MKGRPPGNLTRPRRVALEYHNRCQAEGRKPVLGELVRVGKFSCRANAKRAMTDLKRHGYIPDDQSNPSK